MFGVERNVKVKNKSKSQVNFRLFDMKGNGYMSETPLINKEMTMNLFIKFNCRKYLFI